MKCSLCNSKTDLFSEVLQRVYFRCPTCDAIMLDSRYHLPLTKEKQRYLLHNNNVNNHGYQKFVSPIVKVIIKEQTPMAKGLDFGSGSQSVIAKLLYDSNYPITTYDPIFDPKQAVLNEKYDYIACCEVIEHFYDPAKEFKLLQALLKSNGTLYCKTNLFDTTISFDTWWYKNDPTHVFFYTIKTLQWIANHFNFTNVVISKDLIVYKN